MAWRHGGALLPPGNQDPAWDRVWDSHGSGEQGHRSQLTNELPRSASHHDVGGSCGGTRAGHALPQHADSSPAAGRAADVN